MKVLIVDRNPADLLMQADLLGQTECAVILAGSADDALPLIASEDPHLILADIAQLDVGVISPASMLRAVASIYEVPIIAVSSLEELGSLSCSALGCAGLIARPI